MEPSQAPEARTPLDRYRQWVLRETQLVNLSGVPLPRDRDGSPLPVRVPLEKVYIKLLAVKRDEARSQRKREEEDILARVLVERHDPGERKDLAYLRELGEYHYNRAQVYEVSSCPQALAPERALEENHRMVLLGAPGSGKSTLLRYIARCAALDPHGHIPILVPLGEFSAARASNSTLALREFAVAKVCQGDKQMREQVRMAIEEERVLWLLDALDEARELAGEAASQASMLEGRMIVTSRPVGYVSHHLDDLPHFEMLPLSPDNVQGFVRDWFGRLAEQRNEGPEWVDGRVASLNTKLKPRWNLHGRPGERTG